MADDKILSSEKSRNHNNEKLIASENGEGIHITTEVKEPSNIKERIKKSTRSNGLRTLPNGFDEQNGDWDCINSLDPFEILYLDYQQYKYITPAIILNNYAILEKFWKEKVAMMNTGGNRVAFKSKYGEGTVENALQKLKRAFEKLSTDHGIENYYFEINNARLRKGEESLKESIEDMLIDGIVEKSEIELRLERGLKYNLTEEEIIAIIKKALDKNKFKPYGIVSGNLDKDKLLSVSWMTDQKIEEQIKIEEEKKKRGREIFDHVFAYSIEEIGQILFDNEVHAKEYIRDGLIINSIDYFSSSKAKQVLEIAKEKKDEQLKFLQIIYRLNPNLPYRFNSHNFTDFKALSIALFDNQKTGKEHFKQGYIEVWLKECQTENYKKLIKIRDTAENVDLAFLEALYTVNPELPYRLADNILVKNSVELCTEIDKNKINWNAGKKELYNSFILIWLKTIGETAIVDKWDKIKDQYLEKKDRGLEFFMHLLNEKLSFPLIEISEKRISYPKIQSGESVVSGIILTNKTRGFIEGDITFSNQIKGVTLSSKKFSLNVAEGISKLKIDLKIDSTVMLKGVDYKTDIQITSVDNKEIVIPVLFRIVFPQKAFFTELIKYALIFLFIGLIMRGIMYGFGFHDWLSTQYSYYLNPRDIFWQTGQFIYFPIIVLIFIFLLLIISSLWKPIKRTLNLK